MSGEISAGAVSRQDGSPADGVHLLWSAPYESGYSVDGFDIQRRKAEPLREAECYALSAQELADLHRDTVLDTAPAQISFRAAPCPVTVADPPDDPAPPDGEPPARTCVDFRPLAPGAGPNPRTEGALQLRVSDGSGAPAPQTVVKQSGAFVGLDAGFALDVALPPGTIAVEVTLVRSASPAVAEAFEADGTSAGTQTTQAPANAPEMLAFSGASLRRLRIDAPRDELLVLQLCVVRKPDRCIDFSRLDAGVSPNPRRMDGVTLAVRPSTRPIEVRERDGFVGVQCGTALDVAFQEPARVVDVAVVAFEAPVAIEARARDGESVAVAETSGALGQPETVRLEGAAIAQLTITPSGGDVLLLEVCRTPDPGRKECIDLQAREPGQGANPRREGRLEITVRGPDGSPRPVSRVAREGAFTGLDCGFELEVTLPEAARVVEVTLVHFATAPSVHALDAAGGLVAETTAAAARGSPERIRLSGPDIARLVVRSPQDEALLLGVCFELTPSPRSCVDLRGLKPGRGKNPRVLDGVVLTVRDATGEMPSETDMLSVGGVTGLDCGGSLEVSLPAPATLVELTLLHLEQPVEVRALADDGAVVDRRTLQPADGGEETVRFGGPVDRVVVESGDRRTLLLEVCFEVAPSGGPEPEPVIRDERAARPLARAAAARGDAGMDACYAYELDLRGRRQQIVIRAGVASMLAIALRDGKAVDSMQSAFSGATQDARFFNRAADRILMYVPGRANSLEICVEPLLSPEDEAKEWSSVPAIATGIQVPARAVNASLTSAADEDKLAASRLLTGEHFDAQAFRDVSEVLDDAAAAASIASPMWFTTRARERAEDGFLELRGWPYAMAVQADAAWRRMLGFGYLDPGPGLIAGDAYDYRISGRFRRRDLQERLLGFHTVPDGTTLPRSFHLDDVLFDAFAPTALEIWPAAGAPSLRTTGRKGLPLAPRSAGRSLLVRFVHPLKRLVLELEPGAQQSLSYEALPTAYASGLGTQPLTGSVPAAARVALSFTKPIDRLTLKGTGLLYGVRLVDGAPGGSADDLLTRSVVLPGVRYEPTNPPPAPASLGTVNLQEPIAPMDAALGVQRPPKGLGFRLSWPAPPPSGSAQVAQWPQDLDAAPPLEAAAFHIERRRVDTGGPFAAIDGAASQTLLFGNRGARRDPLPLGPGADVLAVFPERAGPVPPVPALIELEDLLVKQAGGPPPGSLHQYRIYSVDAIGRRSAMPSMGSVVRLEKRLAPPQPVGPTTAPPSGATLPRGVRARALQSSDPNLSAPDAALLGASTNALVLEWGWTAEERARDPFAREFRLYWQPVPPDVVHGALSGTAALVDGRWQLAATLDQPVSADAFAGAAIPAGARAFVIGTHTGGQSITIGLERSKIDPAAVPGTGAFELRPVLRGDELRPSRWAQRLAIVPITAAESYQHLVRDRLTVDATRPLTRVWVGVSAADDQSYVADELPAAQPLGGRPGNESSIAPAAASARYIGRPTFNVAAPLPDVPEIVTAEPAGATVTVGLDPPALLASVSVPSGHRVLLERLGMDALAGRLGAEQNDEVRVDLPDGNASTYTLPNASDHAALLQQIRSATPARVEGRFLMDALLNHGHLPKLEPLWGASAQAAPIAFAATVDTLPAKAERYVYRIRLVDQAGHVSEGAGILPRIVRVPSLRVPAPPQVEVPNGSGATVTVTTRTRDAFDLRWVLLFAVSEALTTPIGARTSARPELLRLPNRRDLYPQHGIRLRLRDGTLLAPQAVDATTGTVQLPDRVLSATLAPAPGHDKRVSVWAVALTRDGIPSSPAGPRTAFTAPPPLTLPALSVQAAGGEDRATWGVLSVAAQVALERSTDAGISWERVTPWLPETVTAYAVPDGSGAARSYRMLLRGVRGELATGSAVTPA